MQPKVEQEATFLAQLIELATVRFRRRGKELAKELGTSASTISRIINGNARYHVAPAFKRATAMLYEKGLSMDTGQDQASSTSNATAAPLPTGLRLVPLMSWASAGSARDFWNTSEPPGDYIETTERDPKAFALTLEGDSMEPEFHAGDRVIFVPNNEPRNGDCVCAVLKDGGGVLFKLYRRKGPEGKTIVLESINPDYQPKEYTQNAFERIYVAVDLKRRLRRI